MNRSKTKTLI